MTAAISSEPALLDLHDVSVDYRVRGPQRSFRAVDQVTLSVGEHETVGLVGESGSGKSTIGRAVLGLTPATAGEIRFAGADITKPSGSRRRELSRDLQVVFQDPYSSLNPSKTIGTSVGEPMRAHGESGSALDERVREVLARVGLDPAFAERYPAQFSGGQRQRIAIARALVLNPRLVICDEPVSSLDLSVQAQVLNLLRGLQDDLGISYLFVAHDLAVVRHLSHRVVVLYRGRVMECGSAKTVYNQPVHPYTRALLAAAPVPDPVEQARRRAERARLRAKKVGGQLAEGGCKFSGRCPFATQVCREQVPVLEETETGAVVACHHWREQIDTPRAASASAPRGD